MKLRLRVLNGPMKGLFAPIRKGLVIGRGLGSLKLKDSKISSKHAQFVENKAGQMFLKDLDSRNGIRQNGKRLKHILLRPGMEIQIGDTLLLVESMDAIQKRSPSSRSVEPKPKTVTRVPVVEVTEVPPTEEDAIEEDATDVIAFPAKDEDEIPTDSGPSPDLEATLNPELSVPEELVLPESAKTEQEVDIEAPPVEWPEFFTDFVDSTKQKIKNQEKQIHPFPNIVQMKFLRGPQIDWHWSMGYGPRDVGRASLDYPLYDDEAPDLAFRIRSQDEHIILETPHSKLVKINDRHVSTDELKNGDLIEIGKTLIQVSLQDK